MAGGQLKPHDPKEWDLGRDKTAHASHRAAQDASFGEGAD